MAATREIIRLDVTESTNLVALDTGAQGAPAGTVVVAEAQTRGRGRLNRSWFSSPGMGLYFSLLLRPNLAAADLPKITLAAGLAVCKVVEAAYDLAPQIKWPNDLLLSGRKFGGILTETGSLQSTSASHPLVVVGVGLNLFSPEGGFPDEIKESPTSLAMHVSIKISTEILLEACVSAIEDIVERLEKGDFPKILEEWKQRDVSRDKVLTWVTPRGKEVAGISLGPGPDGVLRIRDRAGTIHEVLSGDVTLAGKISKEHS